MRDDFRRWIGSGLVGLVLLTGLLPTHAASADPDDVTIGVSEISYRTRLGDTLAAIAAKFTATPSNWMVIARLNGIRSDTRLAVGTLIHIPADLLADQPVEATVVALSGIATATNVDKTQMRLIFGARIVEGMQIETSANGFIVLELTDHSRISLPSNSLIRITTLRATRYTRSPRTTITVVHGSVESVVSPLKENKGSYRIFSPSAVAGVRGTHFRVAVLANGSTANALFDGVIELERPAFPQRATLQRGFGNIVSADGIGAAIPLLGAPNLRQPPETQDSTGVRFYLTPEPGAVAYHVQVASDIEARHPFIEARSATPQLSLGNLDDGDYSLRMSAVDANGIEGFSRVIPISLQRKNGLNSSSNVLSAPWLGSSDSQQFTLRWRSPPATEFRIQVARDSAFSWLLFNTTTTVPTLTLPRPPFGTYYTRVQRKNRDGSFSHFSPVQAFVVTDQWIIPDGTPLPSATTSAY